MQGSSVIEYKKSLVAELAQAKGLLIQLEAHLEKNSSVDQFCRTSTPKILSFIDRSLYIVKSLDLEPEKPQKQHHVPPVMITGDFPRCASNSPRSIENSDQAFKDQNQKEICKKRKTLPKWTSQVRLGAAVGAIEGPVDDGHSWRKYGQKDILGAKFPRGYYRCTHRNSQGCQATKQVQRSDNDPQIFDITYHGTHTCLSRNQSTVTLARRENQQKQNYQSDSQQQVEKQFDKQNQDLLLSVQTGLQVKTEGLNFDAEQNDCLSLAFGSSLVDGITPENNIFFSPTTSESTYFSTSPCRMNNLELEHILQNSESDIAEMISTPNSSCSSTIVDMDLMFDFNTDFQFDQFDASNFFS